MSSETEYAVTVALRRPDGSIDNVRIGTAIREGSEFRLQFDNLRIVSSPAAAPAPAQQQISSTPSASSSGMVFPNYGMSKNRPIAGASMRDLEFYANGCRRSLNDPSKARWHDRDRLLLQAIEAEIARQRGTSSAADQSAVSANPSFSPAASIYHSASFEASHPRDDVPPPNTYDGPPMDDDDDIPF